jgi:TPR repeat protein
MSARRAVPHVFLLVIIAINFISFTQHIYAQQCQMAHDKNELRALQDRADTGNADAQCGLGKQFEHALGVPQDNTQAVIWLRKAAEQGNVAAQVELGIVFDNMQDYAQALVWYRKAAEQGNARAEYNLGLVYQNGEGVPKDMEQAISWYRKAADQGDVIAQNYLGAMYENGIGVPPDYLKAADLYRRAAEKGFAEAQYGLGFLYLYGKGVPKDSVQAVTWMLKAAEQGETKAQFNLGSCYINGEGVERDLNEGYFWIFLADARTVDSVLKEYAEHSLEQLNGAMKKNDIKHAQKQAQAWLNQHPPLAFEKQLVQFANTTP